MLSRQIIGQRRNLPRASPENQPGHWRERRGFYAADQDAAISARIAAAIHGQSRVISRGAHPTLDSFTQHL